MTPQEQLGAALTAYHAVCELVPDPYDPDAADQPLVDAITRAIGPMLMVVKACRSAVVGNAGVTAESESVAPPLYRLEFSNKALPGRHTRRLPSLAEAKGAVTDIAKHAFFRVSPDDDRCTLAYTPNDLRPMAYIHRLSPAAIRQMKKQLAAASPPGRKDEARVPDPVA